jgi:phosphate transport system ATP-binding protein
VTGESTHYALRVADLDVFYGKRKITALIGPSGCGKSTVLRCFNRMNDLIPTARVAGTVEFRGKNLYAPEVDAVEVRRRIGMVFQKPNPFPKSIYENIAWGADQRLPRATWTSWSSILAAPGALWDEVKDKLKQSGYSSPAGSSSACASPAPSPPAPTSS